MSSITSFIGKTIPEKAYEREATPKLLEYAQENRPHGRFNDVTVKVKRYSFPANRMVLSCCSRYFERMFTTSAKDRTAPTVEVESVDSDSMNHLIEYMYTGKIVLDCRNVVNILIAADYLQIDDIQKMCFHYLQKAISPKNCFTLLALAERYSNQTLKNICQDCIVKNIKEIMLGDGFNQCSKQELADLIAKFRETDIEEMMIFKLIVAWTKHDKENRAPGFSDLLQLINFDKIPTQFIEAEVCDEELMTINPDCAKIMNKAVKKRIGRMRKRQSGGRIVSIGGLVTSLKTTEVLNIHKEPFIAFPDLPEERMSGCALRMRDLVYYIGGNKPDEDRASNVVWSMNLNDETLKWKEEPPMIVNRKVMGCAVTSPYLVVVGGADENRGFPFSSCEAFSPSLGSWNEISSLIQSRTGHAVVSCDNALYALGGYNSGYLSTVEKMSNFETWENINPMQVPRRWLAAVSCKGCVYAIGGQSSDKPNARLKNAEKYDPILDAWSFIRAMNFARCTFKACVVEDKIYVVGGLDEKLKCVKEIECYDPAADMWTVVGETEDPLRRHSLVVV